MKVASRLGCGSLQKNSLSVKLILHWTRATSSTLALKNLELEIFSENTSVLLICTLKEGIGWRVGENE